MKIKKIIVEKCYELDKSNFNNFKSDINDYIEKNSFSYYIDDEELKYYFNMSNEDLKKEIEKISKRIIREFIHIITTSPEIRKIILQK
jgi:hypothetical protein